MLVLAIATIAWAHRDSGTATTHMPGLATLGLRSRPGWSREERRLGSSQLPTGPTSEAGQPVQLVASSRARRRLQRTERTQRAVVITVSVALFGDVLLLLMIVPMLPSLLAPPPAGVGAAGDFALAVIFVAKDVFQLLCAPLAGALTLRYGARASLAASLAGLTASTVAFAEAATFKQLLAARCFQGATSSALMSGGLTLIAETHTPDCRGAAMARANSGLGIGAALGPVLGGLLLEALGRRRTFYCVALLIGLTAVAAAALGRAAPTTSQPTSASMGRGEAPVRQLLALVRIPAVGVACSGLFAALAAGGLFDALFGIHLSETYGIGPARASLIFSIEPTTYLLTLALLGGLADVVSKPVLSAAALGLVGLSLPLLTIGPSLVSVFAATLIHGIGYGCKDVVGAALLADLVDRHGAGSYAMAFALADMSDSLGYVLGPLGGVALCKALGSRTLGLSAFALGCWVLVPSTLRLVV